MMPPVTKRTYAGNMTPVVEKFNIEEEARKFSSFIENTTGKRWLKKRPIWQKALAKTLHRKSLPPKMVDLYWKIMGPDFIFHYSPASRAIASHFMKEQGVLKKGSKIVSLGTTQGLYELFLAKNFLPEGEIIAVDRIEKFKRDGEMLAKKAGIKNVRFIAGDALQVPLSDTHYDAALFTFTQFSWDNRWPLFAKEARRFLKPGGLLVLTEPNALEEEFQRVLDRTEPIGFKHVANKLILDEKSNQSLLIAIFKKT
jgi:SAM-dependent methyltransferase